ncbi:hypothetical protein [Sphingomonas sp. Leaf226]|uniref:hypothetical protein n=1 Tax=Sphingomonas sp. Leaf226 TaxID=1735691 RepID=UPI000AA361B2|nr:hypothetical protein [Sphingomonas sp. Leaf226]
MLKLLKVLIVLAVPTVASPPVKAQRAVRQSCNNNTEGPRKSIQCTFVQPQVGMVWKGSAVRARKLYISKPTGDTGQDIVRLWIDGKPSGEIIINPGYNGNIFRKKGNSTIVARAEVETLKLPASGESTIYVHFETLDRPDISDLTTCSNTATTDRQSVCWTGKF